MSRYYDDDDDDYRRRPSSSHGRNRHHHLDSDEIYSDSAGLPPPYMTNAVGGGRLAYDPNTPVFPPPPNASDSDFTRHDSLQVPSSRHRPRSQPPASSTGRSELSRRGSDRSDRSDRSPSRDRGDGSHSPLEKVKHAADKTFSTSKSGIGVGVLGAIVGGFAAHEASEAASRARDKRDHRHHNSKDHQRATLISTIVGAAVGGLGANAIEKRIEHRRQEREYDSRDREHRPRELEYHGSGGSRGISNRSHSQSRSIRDDDSDDDYESNSGRGRRYNRERALVISRSPSAGSGRSRSNSRNRIQRPQYGGAADSYYSQSRSYDDRGR
ncbi:hypothetical protein SEUCBS139899_000412 [Sporothrix eucalyptigena]|uniref:Glycine zipper 2TM domain-containing protein n=1 Tax=Sporothrix eucalyptigena TaxID=1812306 RepID=A0ABP0BE51_9PEZI